MGPAPTAVGQRTPSDGHDGRDAHQAPMPADDAGLADRARRTAHELRGAPVVHLVLAALAALAMLIGGTITFGSWGIIDVRLVALYGLVAIGLHAASRYTGQSSFTLRVLAWVTLGAMAVHTRVLLRVEVLVPLLALAALDLAIHRTRVTSRLLQAGRGAKVIAGLATLGAVGLAGTLVFLALDALILFRLTSTVLVGWALLTYFALRPEARTNWLLLGGAGTFSLTFLLLAAPVLPFGPLLAYWVLIAAMALAVLTGTVTHTNPPVPAKRKRHAQRVHPMPDPVLAPLAEDIRRFLNKGTGGRRLSRRIERALDRDEEGMLLPALSEAQAKGTRPSRADRMRAFAELMELELSIKDQGTAAARRSAATEPTTQGPGAQGNEASP